MTRITWQGQRYELQEGETVLEALLRIGASVPYSCRSGVCQTCMMRAVAGDPGEASRHRLSEEQRARGAFLPCICHPQTDLELAPMQDELPIMATTVVSKTPLGDVLRLRLAPRKPISFRAGQFINVHAEDGVVRSYSIASVPTLDDGVLELHVRRLPDGRVSTWLHEVLREGDELCVQGPLGECCYVLGETQRPLLLIGTGSGLAPLWGILRDALHNGHTGPIYLYHGSRDAEGLYLHDELCALEAMRPEQFHYIPCVSGPNVSPDCRSGRASDAALADHSKLTGWRVYVCGHPQMVEETRRSVFLAGARIADIHTDAFTLSR
ncbi:MAG: 2Fe-2S iron-sulfur cluster binding domain-containing protein [Chromatiales bacterium]|jgi:NAD(P)H-flavin reductase/ferredoxin|nr:2Fe-2S iron-sulfur cluster binding domain-containing protein [Chromatiales bacterium]